MQVTKSEECEVFIYVTAFSKQKQNDDKKKQ